MIRKEYNIPDMECSMCVMHLEGIEDEVEGIIQIEANYHRQKMVVVFDETILNENRIIEAIQKKGYTVA